MSTGVEELVGYEDMKEWSVSDIMYYKHARLICYVEYVSLFRDNR
jgi:hypothetical protein